MFDKKCYLKGGDHVENLGIDRKILKWILGE
jgi:hypothetical protein